MGVEVVPIDSSLVEMELGVDRGVLVASINFLEVPIDAVAREMIRDVSIWYSSSVKVPCLSSMFNASAEGLCAIDIATDMINNIIAL